MPSEGGLVKIDTHVHTHYSGYIGLARLTRSMRESYNTPERVYALARARGMDLIAITNHDTISGARTLAERPDVIVGCEVTAHFRDGVRVHERIGMLLRHPLARRNLAVCGVAIAACPLVLVPLVQAHGHFRDEERFTESLLLDLVAGPPVSGQAVPEAA